MRRRLPFLLGLLVLVGGGRVAAAPAQLPSPTPTATATPTPTPSPAPTEAPPPAPPPPLLPPQTELLVPELASDAFTSPRLLLRWRGRGADEDRAAAFLVDVRPLGLRSAADWRTLVAGSPAQSAAFTGAPGTAYVVRARTRAIGEDAFGPPASATVLEPLDERNRAVRLSRGWRRQRRSGAWNGATALASSSKATAKLRFTKRRVRVIVRRSPSAGRLAVSLDGRRSVVSLAGPLGERQVAFDSGPLRRGAHRLTLRSAGGRVEIDAIAPS
ncbi:MAG: hypothetical protein ABI611_12320 [Solirubrobacteraceae bacterium]